MRYGPTAAAASCAVLVSSADTESCGAGESIYSQPCRWTSIGGTYVRRKRAVTGSPYCRTNVTRWSSARQLLPKKSMVPFALPTIVQPSCTTA